MRPLTEHEFSIAGSETGKHRWMTAPYCVGNGIDIGSGGDPVVPWAIQVELSDSAYSEYNSGLPTRGAVHYRDDKAFLNLPFKDRTLDWVFSSHLIEDFLDWFPILREWKRVLKIGGTLIICLPDKTRWNEAIRRGQPPNKQHRHESTPGELTNHARSIGGLEVLEDRLTDSFNTERVIDYNILFVAKKIR